MVSPPFSYDYPPSRVALREWVNAPLSEVNRAYRLERLGAAFGLSPDYLLRVVNADAGTPARYLMQEILAWTEAHPDLSHNSPDDPETSVTMFASLKLD